MLRDYWQRMRMIRRDPWIALLASTLVPGFAWLGIMSMLLNLYLRRVGFGAQFIGAFAGVGMLSYALAALLGAALYKRIGARLLMIVGELGWLLGAIAISVVDLLPKSWQAPWALVMCCFAYAFLSLAGVSIAPYVTGATTAEERPHAFAIMNSLSPLGAVAGSLIGGALPGVFGALLGLSSDGSRAYGYAILAGNLVFLPAIWALSGLPHDAPRALRTQAKAQIRRSIAPYGALAAMGLISLLRVGGEFIGRSFFSLYMDDVFAMPTAGIGAIMSLANLLAIPAPLLTPPLVQKAGRAPALVVSVLGVAGSLLILGLVRISAVAAISFALLITLAAMARAVWMLLCQEWVAAEWRSTSSAITSMASGVGGFAMVLASGYVIAALGYAPSFGVGALSVALGAITIWAYFGRRVAAPEAESGVSLETR